MHVQAARAFVTIIEYLTVLCSPCPALPPGSWTRDDIEHTRLSGLAIRESLSSGRTSNSLVLGYSALERERAMIGWLTYNVCYLDISSSQLIACVFVEDLPSFVSTP